MSRDKVNFEYCDEMVSNFEQVVDSPRSYKGELYTGVDLGTACVVLSVLDSNMDPVAGAYKYADVVRDGMVTDYIGAVDIVKSMKADIEDRLECELLYGAAAIPPGTERPQARTPRRGLCSRTCRRSRSAS